MPSARSVLDVGCGPGGVLRAISRLYPDMAVVGLDVSVERVIQTLRTTTGCPNITIYQGAASRLPFTANRFDLVYCRFLLEYLPDQAAAVDEMVRVCRPGGRVLLQDLDGQLVWHYPPEEQIEREIQCVLDCLAATGFDPFAGRKLFSLARKAGLQDLTVQAESYHLIAGRISERNYELWKLKLGIAFPAMMKALGSRAAAESLRTAFLNYLQREDTLTYSVVFTVTGRKPTQMGH